MQQVGCDGEFCLPIIVDGNHISESVRDKVDDNIVVVVSDGNDISESVRNTVNGIVPVVTDGND